MQKTSNWMLLLLMMSALAGVALNNGPEAKATTIRYLALGDSYTIGESVPSSQRWPAQLADSLRAHGLSVEQPTVIARTGWRSDNLLAALDQDKGKGNYDLVSLLIGVNDFFQGRDQASYLRHLDALLDRAVASAGGREGRVLVLSIPDYSYTPAFLSDKAWITPGIDAFNAACRERCLSRGIAYVDITPISRWPRDPDEWVAYDGLHPSAQQYTAWTTAALPIALGLLK